MHLFKQLTRISLFKNVASFAEEMQIDERDFILAARAVFEKYFAPLNLPAQVVFRSDYGKSEPTDRMTDALITDFNKSGCNRIVAIGGGSVIDMAKVLMIKDARKTESIFLREVPIVKGYKLIAVPTTCGAGSEVSPVSIVSLTRKGTKVGLSTEEIIPDHAALIPQLLEDMPYRVFATSAIDALIHAVEAFLCPKANAYTDLFSEQAIRTILTGFCTLRQTGETGRLNLLEDFLIASNMAGIAFANAGTGAVHALSYPLSTQYHVTHGEACYQFFTAVLHEYQHQNPQGKILRLREILADTLNCGMSDVFILLEDLLDRVIPRQPLHCYGMAEADIESFADNVLALQERLLSQSYCRLNREAIVRIYRSLL
ncbi:MAG: 4-hydroxybutyrate dehydrogenase [Saccharofermentanales bacterium]|jgi:4-hydroxybutyrate dehydrogenase|nr:4-hydroxybutyrate dehydrogenase [Bacillota bacterium]